jgi:alpha-L-fucosidase 2
LKSRLIPMAASVLKYFDSRFRKDDAGKIVLDPTQVVETYWKGVLNDMPTTSGLIAMTNRLCDLPPKFVPSNQRTLFAKMRAACPDLPFEMRKGQRQLAPAQRYNPEITNVENGELYGVWPARVVSLAHPEWLPEAKNAYAHRLNHLDNGWGYDGNVAALLGMTDEAERILRIKCANSHPAYRWPATWGPNFDWLPDQNHGGNLLNTANLMLMQAEPIEAGGAIRILPAWPEKWDVDFKLHAPGKTTVHCVLKNGHMLKIEVTPRGRLKDVIVPQWVVKPTL